VNEPRICQVLAFETQGNGPADVRRELVERGSLSDDGQVQTLSHVLVFSAEDSHLDGPLHSRIIFPLYCTYNLVS
jgi:hypothetical protein